MAPILPRADNGLVLDTQAITEKVAKRLGHMYDEIMGVAEQESIIPKVTKAYNLSEDDGLQTTIYDKTQIIAHKKPEGTETTEQRPEVEEKFTIRLEQWESVVGITDEAMIDSGEVNMTAQERQQAGRAGLAFANSIDGDGLSIMYAGVTPVAATALWNVITDIQLGNDLATAVNTIKRRGFKPDIILMTMNQMNRVNDTAWVTQGRTMTQYLQERYKLTPIEVSWVGYDDRSGNEVQLFNPVGQCMILDSRYYSIFSQRPATVEVERNVSRGINFAFFRKFFKTTIADAEAAFVFDTIGY